MIIHDQNVRIQNVLILKIPSFYAFLSIVSILSEDKHEFSLKFYKIYFKINWFG